MAGEDTHRSEIDRYERRLSRERQARLAAESIAEDRTRKLYEQTRQLELIQSVNGVANLATDPQDAFRHALEGLTAFMGWDLGHALFKAPRGPLRSTHIWIDDGRPAFAAFRDVTVNRRFKGSEGLPGRAAATREALWIGLDDNDEFLRCQSARAAGLRSGLAFPIRIGNEVVAVMEFFSTRIITPSPALMRVLESIGVQLGRVVERHRTERAMRRQNRTLARLAREAAAQASAAEAASRAKSAFLAVTSHEIRTPLNAVLGLAHVLNDQLEADKHKDMTQGILDSGALLVRLLNAVLDFSRIEAGTVVAASEAYDLAALTRRTVALWSPLCAARGVTLSVGLDQFCASGDRLGDPDKIEQTLVNLLSNALKFTPDGGAIDVKLSGPDANGFVRLDIVDDGPGVPVEDRERIFVAYEQTDSGRRAGGAGLGLAICAGNVHAVGGQIAADRDAADKSRFWFSFPAPAAAVSGAVVETTAANVNHAGPLQILAAEDNPANRRVLTLLLAEIGVELTCVEDGAQAVEAVQTASYDLVLMDANMPIMGGPEAVQAIRALGPAFLDLPIHMLTANVFEDDVNRYLRAGADGVLAKPIEISRLYETITAADAVRDRRRVA